MGGPKWSAMSDKSTCQHIHKVSFPALPSPNSPRSGKAIRHGSLVLALPRLPMSLTGHRPCGMTSLSPGPIPISFLAWIANHAGFPPSKRPGLFHLKDLCSLLASAPGLPREVLSRHSGLRQLLPLQRSFAPPQVHRRLFYFLHSPCQYLNIKFVYVFISVLLPPSRQVPGGQR